MTPIQAQQVLDRTGYTDARITEAAAVSIGTVVPLTPELQDELQRIGIHKGALQGDGVLEGDVQDRQQINLNKLVAKFPAAERAAAIAAAGKTK